MKSVEDLKAVSIEIFSGIDLSDRESMDAAMHKHFSYLTKHYEEFDEDAKSQIDRMMDSLIQVAKSNINSMEDGVDKTKALRLVSLADEDCLNASALLKILERPTEKDLEILRDTRAIFEKQLQTVLNLLSDVTNKSVHGIDQFATLSLFYFGVDELLTAFHLSQHSFINQAYTHIRTIHELLEKIQLFYEQPEWAELWSSTEPKDQRKILRELSPASVREKLGKKRFDPIYSMFSELGPHGTFRGIQSRTARQIDQNDEERPNINMWVGGNPFIHNIVWINSFLLYSLTMVILKLTTVYGSVLNQEELRTILYETQSEMKIFIEKHYVTWLIEEGFDPKPLIDILERLVWEN